MKIPNPPRGFTLVEALVALAVLALLFVGVLQILDVSSQTSKVESALADTQENVRFAAYHIMRHARMMGGAEIPMAEGSSWLTAQIVSNYTTSATTTAFGNITKDRASDVLVCFGFFDHPIFAIHRSRISTTASPNTVTVHEWAPQTASGRLVNPLDGIPSANAYSGQGLVLIGPTGYGVASIPDGAALQNTGPTRQLVIPFTTGVAPWTALNPSGTFAIPNLASQAGVISGYAFWVEDGTLWRRRTVAGGTTIDESVAIDIGGLQLTLGLDTNGDGAVDSWDPAPSAATVAGADPLALRIAILGRTPFSVQQWTEPVGTFDAVDPGGTTLRGVVDRSAKWRTIQVTAALRNFIL